MDKTTAWTIIGSVFVAILSQMINYYLIQKNENKKFNKKRFQKLYSPSIYHLVDLLTSAGYYHANPTLNNTSRRVNLLNSILENTSENLELASPELVNEYRKLDRVLEGKDYERVLKDLDNDFFWNHLIDFSTIFIREYLSIKRMLSIKTYSTMDQIKGAYFFCLFFSLIFNTYIGIKQRLSSKDIFKLYHEIEEIVYDEEYSWDKIYKIGKLNDKLDERWFNKKNKIYDAYLVEKGKAVISKIFESAYTSEIENLNLEMIDHIKEQLKKI